MESHQEKFEDYCWATFNIAGENKGSKTITRAKGDKIVKLLSKKGTAEDFTPKFKHWVKSRGFQLITYSALASLMFCACQLRVNDDIIQ